MADVCIVDAYKGSEYAEELAESVVGEVALVVAEELSHVGRVGVHSTRQRPG